MIEVVCPVDKTVHFADASHVGKMLRCGTCGDPILIRGTTVTSGGAKMAAHQAWKKAPIPPTNRLRTIVFNLGSRSVIALLVSAALCVFLVVAFFSAREQSHLKGLLAGMRNSSLHSTTSPSDPWSVAGESHDAPTNSGFATGSADSDKRRTDIFDSLSAPRSFPTGTRMAPDHGPQGLGVLNISNYSGYDSVVKVFSLDLRRSIRTIFVASNSEAKLSGIPPGNFQVRFALGFDWDGTAHRFNQSRQFFEFGKTLDYSETEEADRTIYSQHSITLHTTPDGNVPRRSIDQGDFEDDALR